MTDTEELELFDDATEEFPAKEDLKDRLVLIWATGRHGTRLGSGKSPKPYAWYETYTVVIDDGPEWDGYKIKDGERKPMLVDSVKEHGPQHLDGFQFSTGGMTSRLEKQVNLSVAQPPVGKDVTDKPKSFRPTLGRINSRKNSQPGYSASWSISEPTSDDKVIARGFADVIRQVSATLEARINGEPANEDDEAFD